MIAFQKVEAFAASFQQLAITKKLTKKEYAYWEAKVRQAYKDWLGFAQEHHDLDPRSELAIATEQCLAIIDSWKVVSIFVPKGLIGRGNPTPPRDMGTDESLSWAYRLGYSPRLQPEARISPGP